MSWPSRASAGPTAPRRPVAGQLASRPQEGKSLRSGHVSGSARLLWAPPSPLRIGSAARTPPGSANQPPFPPWPQPIGPGREANQSPYRGARPGGWKAGGQRKRARVPDGFLCGRRAANSPFVSRAAYVVCTRRGSLGSLQAGCQHPTRPPVALFSYQHPLGLRVVEWPPKRHLRIDTFPGSRIGLLSTHRRSLLSPPEATGHLGGFGR